MFFGHTTRRISLAVLSIVASLSGAAVQAESPITQRDWHSDISVAWKEAKQLGRPILIYVASNQCTYCRKMERATLEDPKVAKQVKDGFVRVSINGSKQPRVAKSLRIRAYPTTLVYGHDGKLITSMRGYVGPEEFGQRLKAVKTD